MSVFNALASAMLLHEQEDREVVVTNIWSQSNQIFRSSKKSEVERCKDRWGSRKRENTEEDGKEKEAENIRKITICLKHTEMSWNRLFQCFSIQTCTKKAYFTRFQYVSEKCTFSDEGCGDDGVKGLPPSTDFYF